MGPGQEGETPRLLPAAAPGACLAGKIQAGAGQRSPCELALSVKPGMGLGAEASAQQPRTWTRPASSRAISPASSWSRGYCHCHCQCLIGGIPEKQGRVGRWGGGPTGLGTRQMLMRQLGLAPEADPAQAPGTSAAGCPGNSQPPPPSQPQRPDRLRCQEPVPLALLIRTPQAGRARDTPGTPSPPTPSLRLAFSLAATACPRCPPASCLLPSAPGSNHQGLKPLLAEVASRISSLEQEAKGDLVARWAGS